MTVLLMKLVERALESPGICNGIMAGRTPIENEPPARNESRASARNREILEESLFSKICKLQTNVKKKYLIFGHMCNNAPYNRIE